MNKVVICRECEFTNPSEAERCNVCGSTLKNKNDENVYLENRDEIIFEHSKYYELIFYIFLLVGMITHSWNVSIRVIKNQNILHQQEKKIIELEENINEQKNINKDIESKVIIAQEEANKLLEEVENKLKSIEYDQSEFENKKIKLESDLNNDI
jgi:ribosomal protein L40E